MSNVIMEREDFTPVTFEKITQENINFIPSGKGSTEVIAISFAEVGAMGDSGEVCIVVRDENWELKGYETNYMYGIFKHTESIDDWQNEEEILFKLLPILKEIDFNAFARDYSCNPIRGHFSHGIWQVMDMGFGNHLLAADKLGRRILQFGDAPLGDLYSNWKSYIASYAHSLKNGEI